MLAAPKLPKTFHTVLLRHSKNSLRGTLTTHQYPARGHKSSLLNSNHLRELTSIQASKGWFVGKQTVNTFFSGAWLMGLWLPGCWQHKWHFSLMESPGHPHCCRPCFTHTDWAQTCRNRPNVCECVCISTRWTAGVSNPGPGDPPPCLFYSSPRYLLLSRLRCHPTGLSDPAPPGVPHRKYPLAVFFSVLQLTNRMPQWQ